MKLECSQTLELKLKLRQSLELDLKLLHKLPEEFTHFLNIEKDGDIDLLGACLPFLALHEYSHPLQAKGLVYVPAAEELIVKITDMNPRDYSHNANEVGIDRSAMLLGQKIGYYSQIEMVCSHTAMMNRIFRDFFTLNKFTPEITFVARLYSEMKEHVMAEEVVPQDKAKLEQLMGLAEGKFPTEEFHAVVGQYEKIYAGTRLVKTGASSVNNLVSKFN